MRLLIVLNHSGTPTESRVWIRFSSVHLISALECYRGTDACTVHMLYCSLQLLDPVGFLVEEELHKVEAPTSDSALLRGEHSCSAAVRKKLHGDQVSRWYVHISML